MFNLLALVWLELARHVFFLGLLAWLGLVACFALLFPLCCGLLARFASLWSDIQCLSWLVSLGPASLESARLGLAWLAP